MPNTSTPIHFELSVLGSGAGASYLYDNLPSSSLMLLANQQPICLIDLGLGVSQQVLAQFKGFPEQIIITHNHSDHAGELPVILRVEQARGRKLQVFAEQAISERLQTHRMAEHHQMLAPTEIADWIAPEAGKRVALSHGLEIVFYPGVHSEASCGFILYEQETALLSYTGDSQLNADFYQTLNQAKTFIMDARPKPNPWHADFTAIQAWLNQLEAQFEAQAKTPITANVMQNRYILGHGLNPKQDNRTQLNGLQAPLLFTGDRVRLN
ncbi:MAG: MBL fold metallo-hydrolase [Gammaproteobacteria bacterium]|nr:MBL fold metallo-hydrolase [Gammaproteobacteria bacterium]